MRLPLPVADLGFTPYPAPIDAFDRFSVLARRSRLPVTARILRWARDLIAGGARDPDALLAAAVAEHNASCGLAHSVAVGPMPARP